MINTVCYLLNLSIGYGVLRNTYRNCVVKFSEKEKEPLALNPVLETLFQNQQINLEKLRLYHSNSLDHQLVAPEGNPYFNSSDLAITLHSSLCKKENSNLATFFLKLACFHLRENRQALNAAVVCLFTTGASFYGYTYLTPLSSLLLTTTALFASVIISDKWTNHKAYKVTAEEATLEELKAVQTYYLNIKNHVISHRNHPGWLNKVLYSSDGDIRISCPIWITTILKILGEEILKKTAR